MATTAEAQRWIQSKLDSSSTHPLAQSYRDLASLYEDKLWHQLTIQLETMIANEYWVQNNATGELHELYSNFISSFTNKLNPLTLSLMAITFSKFFADLATAITFLEDIVTRVSGNAGALVVSRCTLAKLKLLSGAGPECKKILEEARVTLDNIEGAESSVFIAYYDASTAYFEKYGPAAEYFKNGLLYLAYTPLDTIPLARQKELAFSLCVASLVGESVYSFGELLSQPLLQVLDGSDQAWIIQIVQAFNAGDIDTYERLQVTFKDQLNAEAVMLQNVRLLTEKISVLALMELVFKRPSEDRAIPFSVIAEHTKLAENEVELLVMKALSLKLVKGAIDQVDQVVTFTWVQPRVLDVEQIAGLKNRLAHWQKKVQHTLIDVENQAHELFV